MAASPDGDSAPSSAETDRPGIEIRVDLSRVERRTLGVEVAVECTGAAAPLEFLLPVWTPGSYLIREYSRHLSGVVAVDGVSGRPLAVEKTEKNRYRVDRPKDCSRVVLRYSVYAHSLTVREAWVGEEFAYWNGACIYLWPADRLDRSASVRVDLRPEWEFYSGAESERLGGYKQPAARFSVANLDEAVDMPCLAMTRAQVVAFEALGVPHRFVCAGLEPFGLPSERLVEHTRRVIGEAAAVFGVSELPFDDYTFLSLFSANGRGGLEHANSSTLLAPRTTFGTPEGYRDFVSLVAHEFFHVWNVKRLRPVEFHRFDYEREVYSSLLWVAEGFTAYYDDHLCLRAGVMDAATYLGRIAAHVDSMKRMPGRLAQSLAESSFDAWIRFYRQDENTRNITQNYYANGALAAICIDAKIREASNGARCLDDVMKRMWQRHAESGYGHDDVVAACSDAAGVDLGTFVDGLVAGPFDPDLGGVLGTYGLQVRSTRGGAPRLGLQFRPGSLGVAIVVDDSAAFEAGIAPGDEILALDGVRVRFETWKDVLSQLAAPGRTRPLRVCLDRDGILRDVELDLARASVDAGTEIVADPEADETRLRHREAWLGPTARELATAAAGRSSAD